MLNWLKKISMTTIARCMTAAVFLSTTPSVFAGMQDEIQYLLQYVEISGCEFERNGTVYDSREARSHIERKYNYVRKYVDNTEDFTSMLHPRAVCQAGNTRLHATVIHRPVPSGCMVSCPRTGQIDLTLQL